MTDPNDSFRTRFEHKRDQDRQEINTFFGSSRGFWTVAVIIGLLVITAVVTEFV